MYNKQRKFSQSLLKQIDILYEIGIIENRVIEYKLPTLCELNENYLVKLLVEEYVNTDNKLYIVPNEGNGGDAFIALGTIHFLKKHNILYKILQSFNEINEEDKLVYSGGGNLVSHYPHCEMFLKRFSNNKILILPHTINKNELLKTLNKNVTIITRDKTSYYNCKNNFKHTTYLHPDMAFYINMSNINPSHKMDEIQDEINCFRNDVERTITNVPNNIDISDNINYDRYMKNEELIEKTVVDIFKFISKFKQINTNRLHICIAGSLLGKKINFSENSYWKNIEVYKYSPLKDNVNIKI
jgi:exopolysaccharide biosynthesis predicted pyruvyltransferase EpsI